MKSIERRFKNLAAKNYGWSSYSCFSEAIRQQNFSSKNIHLWFLRLVDKNDYASSDKRAILEYLCHLSKWPEEGIKQGQTSPGAHLLT